MPVTYGEHKWSIFSKHKDRSFACAFSSASRFPPLVASILHSISCGAALLYNSIFPSIRTA